MQKKTFDDDETPLEILCKILANALLDDQRGINLTAKNALLILADLVRPGFAEELEKKIIRNGNRYRYDQ